jgi:hypothetical protein
MQHQELFRESTTSRLVTDILVRRTIEKSASLTRRAPISFSRIRNLMEICSWLRKDRLGFIRYRCYWPGVRIPV